MRTTIGWLAIWTLAATFVQASEPDASTLVTQRWEIAFGDDFPLKEYARILDCFGIEIGYLGIGEVTYLKRFSTGQPEVYYGPPADEKRLYWSWKEGALAKAEEELFNRAGIAIPDKRILHFYPEKTERQLLQLERDYRGRETSGIRKTRFAVRRQGDSYAFYVVDQEPVDKPPIDPQPADSPQEKEKSSTEFECRWADGPIVIDGKADDAAWNKTQVIDRFSLPWLGDARPAKTATKARLLWDRENLYFFAEMEDTDLYADVTEHDGITWENDVFELFFKPADDQPGYYEFQVNAAGTIMDMFLPRRASGGYRRFKSDGAFHVEAKVALAGTLNRWQDHDTGWAVEGRIPWSDFLRTGGRPAEDEKWKFALCRYDYSVEFEGPELSTCAPLRSRPSSFHNHEEYAVVRFVGLNAQSMLRPFGIDKYTPLTTSRVVGSPEPPPAYRPRRVLPDLRLSYPVFMLREPGTRRLWIIDQPAPYGPTRIGRTAGEGNTGDVETLLAMDEGIAYSLLFHPDYESNGYVFVGANARFGGTQRKTRVTRYTVARPPPCPLDPASAVTIIEWPSAGHDGAALAFGRDGMLYITSGDGTTDSDTDVVGQDLSKLTAKVLRIDVDHPDADRPYSVPGDNPFVDVAGARPETWAYGLRNPWRMTADPASGQIWVGNNGQDLWEHVFLLERGANYGWSVFEGSHPFYPRRELGKSPHVMPTAEHPHSEARSLTGGVVYHGKKLPELRGAYLYGDYSTGKIWGLRHDGKQVVWHQELADTTLAITAFALDADGELLIADHQAVERGGFYSLEPNDDRRANVAFPGRLSETGLFRSVKDHAMQPGALPYDVNAPLWSDGAQKERWLVLPPTMTESGREIPVRIDFTASRNWDLPERTVLVKSFALETQEGDPASRRWVETRLLTRQQGEWAGYSYRWNDDQTDALLVAKEGTDQEFVIRAAQGQRRQTWHYPSRTECMVCHSRAANFVLGVSTLQLNKDHDYGGVIDNQLRVLEHLGLLRVNYATEAADALGEELLKAGLSDERVKAEIAEATATRGQRTAAPTGLLARSPDRYPRLADPYDDAQPVDVRARSYLHANCAQCHVEAGGGNAKLELRFETALEKTQLIGVEPLHDRFGIEGARLVAPGDPDRSLLLRRMSVRGRGQMPQLATSLVDQRAVDLIRRWIAEMPAGARETKVDGDAAAKEASRPDDPGKAEITFVIHAYDGVIGALGFVPLKAELEKRGYSCKVVRSPNTNSKTPHQDRAKAMVEALKNVEGDIVLVGISNQGLFMPLVAAERPIRRIVMINAVVPWPGKSFQEAFDFEKVFATRFARRLAQGAPEMSEVCLLKELPKVEYVYVCGEEDDAIRPEWEQWAAREYLHVEPVVVKGAGHTNILLYVKQVADAATKGL